MFRKLGLSCSFDLLPHPLPPLCCVALLLFLRHEWPAYPVFILCFLLQAFNHIAFYLPGDNPRSTVLPNPLLSWDSLPQKSQSQEHPAASESHKSDSVKCITKQFRDKYHIRNQNSTNLHINMLIRGKNYYYNRLSKNHF